MMFLVIIIFVLILIGLLYFYPDPEPVIGIYRRPGPRYTFKYWAFYILMTLRKRRSQSETKVTGADAGYGMRSRSSISDMDRLQPLADVNKHPMAVDAVYFNGANMDGFYFVGATARRHANLVQTLLYIRIPGVGLLELPSLPDTSLQGDGNSYSAGGLRLTPVEPMKRWELRFNGKMRLIKHQNHGEPPAAKQIEETVNVSFQLDWTATTGHFDFDTDLNQSALSEAIAREPWTSEFFNSLRVAHQTHYEQFGQIAGIVHIDGYGETKLMVTGIRDHSYGNLRDWRDLHRYAIQYAHFTDGTSVCVGSICMPRTMSRLIIGYVFSPSGQMDAVESTDLQLDQVGENGNDPIDLTFNFVAGGRNYRLECHSIDRPIFYMGRDWESRIHERMVTYKLDGSKVGCGISEWCYRNKAGKTDNYKDRISAWIEASRFASVGHH